MNKFLIILVTVFIVLITAGGIFYAYRLQNDKYQEKEALVAGELTDAENRVSEVKNAEDKNGYSPSDLIRNFMTEFKLESFEKAKLYLSAQAQNTDLKKALKIEKNLSQTNLTDATYTLNNDTAIVVATGTIGTETFSRTFNLVKEENLWKISTIN